MAGRLHLPIDHGLHCFVCRWSSSRAYTKNIFYATLPVDRLLQLLAEPVVISLGYVNIYDSAGLLLAGQSSPIDEKFHLIRAQTISHQLSIEVGIPRSILDDELVPVRSIMVIFGLTSVAFAVLLAVFFAMRGSRPMRNLLSSITRTKHVHDIYEANRRMSLAARIGLQKDYDDLAKSIADIDTQIGEYKGVIDRQTELLRIQVMERTLQRGIYGEQEQREFAELFPVFPAPIRLALLRYKLSPDALFSDSAIIQSALVNMAEQTLNIPYAQGMDGNMVILLLPIGDEEEASVRLQALCDAGVNNFSILLSCSFVLSEICSHPSELTRAYQRIQYSFPPPYAETPLDDGCQISEINYRRNHLPLSVASAQIIYGAFNNGNSEVALSALQDCLGSMPWDDFIAVKHTYNMINNLIVHLKLEYPTTLHKVIVPSLKPENQGEVFLEQLPKCFVQICENIASWHQGGTGAFARQVIDYINSNIYNPDICVDMVANHFGISAPTLQKITRSVTGQTFFSYVEEERLARAYQLLTEDRLPVRDVASICGFANANSFYKAFKRKYSISPNSLRSNVQSGD